METVCHVITRDGKPRAVLIGTPAGVARRMAEMRRDYENAQREMFSVGVILPDDKWDFVEVPLTTLAEH